MGSNPSTFKGPKNPVEQVSWDDCQVFFDKLNARTAGQGGKFVLPTEAEWEYACRGGSATRLSFGGAPGALEDYAWLKDNSDQKTRPVGGKAAERLGVEPHARERVGVGAWTCMIEKYYAYTASGRSPRPLVGPRRMFRGGSWRVPAGGCRSAGRDSGVPKYRDARPGLSRLPNSGGQVGRPDAADIGTGHVSAISPASGVSTRATASGPAAFQDAAPIAEGLVNELSVEEYAAEGR